MSSDFLMNLVYSLLSVLIPLEQGMSSDGRKFFNKDGELCLNPFGTGHVFRLAGLSSKELRELVLIPLEQGMSSDCEGGVEACSTRAEKIGYQLFDEAED